MIRVKDDSVQVAHLSGGILFALQVIEGVYGAHGADEVEITSGNDGRHSLTSLHYDDNAVDIDTQDAGKAAEWTDQHKVVIRNEIKERLGLDFDVILEGVGTPNEHLHIEKQPRRR